MYMIFMAIHGPTCNPYLFKTFPGSKRIFVLKPEKKRLSSPYDNFASTSMELKNVHNAEMMRSSMRV